MEICRLNSKEQLSKMPSQDLVLMQILAASDLNKVFDADSLFRSSYVSDLEESRFKDDLDKPEEGSTGVKAPVRGVGLNRSGVV